MFSWVQVKSRWRRIP